MRMTVHLGRLSSPLCILFFVVCLRSDLVRCSVSVPRGLQEKVAEGGKPGNAGFKIRVTQAGADYVEGLAQQALKDQFPRIRLNDIRTEIQNGDIQLSNMRITSFKSPEKHSVALESPDLIRWTISDADIGLHGDYLSHQQGLLGKVPSMGYFDADAKGVDFTISFSLYKSNDSGLSVKSRQCEANVKSLTATVRNKPGTLGGGLAMLFRNSIINKMRPMVAAQMCQEARRFIDDELSKQLGTMSKKLPLNQTEYHLKKALRDARFNDVSGSDAENDITEAKPVTAAPPTTTTTRKTTKSTNTNGKGTAGNKKNQTSQLRTLATSISKQLILDYSHMKDPTVITGKYVESFNRGEISYEGQGGTPFYPTDLQEPNPPPTDRMVYLIVSDFLLNTLFWHAFKHGLLTFRANKQTNPEYESMLRTSCDDDVFGVCLGSVVPEVGTTYPNSEAELMFQALKAPAAFFQRDGKVKLVAPAYVVAYAKKGNEEHEMITADLNVESQMRVWIEDMTLKGNGSITKFEMVMRRNNLKDFNQEKLDEFANMARAMFQELMNNELMKGLPLPTIEGASLVRPALKVFERTVRVESDMTIDEDVLTLLAIDALTKGNSKVTIDDGPAPPQQPQGRRRSLFV